MEGPKTSWMFIMEMEKQVLPEILYPAMQVRQ
jgi:hypothetical protein